MAFHYDPDTRTCFDPDRAITMKWGGGWGAAGNERESFIEQHAEWEYSVSYYVSEHGIQVDFTPKDPDAQTWNARRHIAPDAKVLLQPSRAGEFLRGNGPLPDDNSDILREGITCLYTQGGRDRIEIIM